MTFGIFFIGILLLLFLALKAFFEKEQFSPLIGYLLLGWIGSVAKHHFPGLMDSEWDAPLSFMANLGIILLLFHIGLETDFSRLMQFFSRAGFIAFGNILTSGGSAFLVSLWVGWSLATSLFIGVAMTATSMGVALALWSRRWLVKTEEGTIFFDLVSIDDIVGILLLAFLSSLFPEREWEKYTIGKEMGFFVLKIAFLVLFCFLFSLFLERPLVRRMLRYEKMPDSLLSILGIGLIISGMAASIQFSMAMGAFFSGMVFSRDPKAVKMETAMPILLDLFVPFFFFWIGYHSSIGSLEGIWPFFFVLLLVAILGKFVGTWIPAYATGMRGIPALALSLSMIPRAEICMVIMEQGFSLGIIAEQIYSMVSLIVLVTCIITPLLLRALPKS